jgi:hypothetical protein
VSGEESNNTTTQQLNNAILAVQLVKQQVYKQTD